MHANDKMHIPDKIVFSGNGSRIISVVSTDINGFLTNFTKFIFEQVYKSKFPDNGFSIELNNDPKEATCKGGFLVGTPDSYDNILKKKIVLHSNETDKIIKQCNDDEPKVDNTYAEINDNYLDKTVKENETFINFVFDVLLPFYKRNGYTLDDNLINTARSICLQKLSIFLKNGWLHKRSEDGFSKKNIIDETLFFYPLKGMLKELNDALNINRTKNANT